MQFYISPSAGHANVEVCVLPVPRAQEDEEFTIDDIKTRGSCTHEMDANGQYFLSFELEPASYTALIYAHSDHSFVSIPALSPLLQGNRYAFQFTMQSCDNTASFEDSDSYSVTISNSYVWSGAEPPRVVVYYTSDLSLTLKDIALFSKKEFTGMTGLANHLFQIAGLDWSPSPSIRSTCSWRRPADRRRFVRWCRIACWPRRMDCVRMAIGLLWAWEWSRI